MDNAAFAKIMATPRPHDAGAPAAKMDKKQIRKLVNADLQSTKSKKHKGDGGGGKKKKSSGEGGGPEAKKQKKASKYRDRAEERRTDSNKDYETPDAARNAPRTVRDESRAGTGAFEMRVSVPGPFEVRVMPRRAPRVRSR